MKCPNPRCPRGYQNPNYDVLLVYTQPAEMREVHTFYEDNLESGSDGYHSYILQCPICMWVEVKG